MFTFDRQLLTYFDWPLFAISVVIPVVGLAVLYSAGYDPDGPATFFSWFPLNLYSHAFEKQILFILIGICALILGLFFTPHFLFRFSYPFYVLCCLMLIAVIPYGIVVHGAKRWLDLGPFNFQPSEVAKLAITLTLARYISKMPPSPGGYSVKQLLVPGLITLFPMLLILKQPDLGTTIALGSVGLLMVMFMGIRVRVLVTMVLLTGIAVPASWHFVLQPYQKKRVTTLFNHESDKQGAGYHIIQSKIAVGSGKMFGKGFLKGTQTQLQFLPEHTTDFVFSVLAEEWGFVGCMFVLFLYFVFLSRVLRVVQRSKDLFASLVAFGIGARFFVDLVINIGMVIGLLPVVGKSLPLFSYGGSSIVSALFGIGIVLGISMRRKSYLIRY